jgi:hypothetical protein
MVCTFHMGVCFKMEIANIRLKSFYHTLSKIQGVSCGNRLVSTWESFTEQILQAVFDLPHQTFSVLGKGIETVATICVLPICNETTHGNLPRKLLSGENTVINREGFSTGNSISSNKIPTLQYRFF